MPLDKNATWLHTAAAAPDFTGVEVAIVGGTGGLGRAVARLVAARGGRVLVVGQTFRDAGVPGIAFASADLGLMREAQRVGRELPAEELDVLLLTTGIFAAPQRQETPEGLERDLAVSYLSRLAIVREVAPRLGKNRPAALRKPRVFVMGYPGNGQAGTPDDLNAERSYAAMAVHMNTVAGNEMLVLDAAKRYPHAGFFGLNPGLVKTNIRDNFLGKDSLKSRLTEGLIGLFAPTAERYAERVAPLLISPDLEDHSGAMFDQKARVILPSPQPTPERVSAFLSSSEALLARATSVQTA